MAKRRHKSHGDHPEEFDLLPFANFFLLVVPFLLSLAVWQKFAVIEIKLAESAPADPNSAPPQGEDVDPNLTIAIASDSLELSVNGGGEWNGVTFPKIYFKEMVTYQCGTDVAPHTIPMVEFRQWSDTGFVVVSKCENGQLARQADIQDIQLIALDRKNKDDKGTEMDCIRESNTNQCLLSGMDITSKKAIRFGAKGEIGLGVFAKELSEVSAGKSYEISAVGHQILGDSNGVFMINVLANGQPRTSIPVGVDTASNVRDAKAKQAHEREVKELAKDKATAFDLLAAQLMIVRKQLNTDPNCDWGPGILRDYGVPVRNETCTYAHKVYLMPDKRVPYDRVAKVMDMARNAGFDQIEFGVLQK